MTGQTMKIIRLCLDITVNLIIYRIQMC